MLLSTDLVLNLYCYLIYEPRNILKCTRVGQENLIFMPPNPPGNLYFGTSVFIKTCEQHCLQ